MLRCVILFPGDLLVRLELLLCLVDWCRAAGATRGVVGFDIENPNPVLKPVVRLPLLSHAFIVWRACLNDGCMIE